MMEFYIFLKLYGNSVFQRNPGEFISFRVLEFICIFLSCFVEQFLDCVFQQTFSFGYRRVCCHVLKVIASHSLFYLIEPVIDVRTVGNETQMITVHDPYSCFFVLFFLKKNWFDKLKFKLFWPSGSAVYILIFHWFSFCLLCCKSLTPIRKFKSNPHLFVEVLLCKTRIPKGHQEAGNCSVRVWMSKCQAQFTKAPYGSQAMFKRCCVSVD